MSRYTICSNFKLPRPKPESLHKWYGLSGVSRTLAIYQSVKLHQHFALLIVKDGSDMQDCYEALSFFASDDNSINIFKFPDTETLPYDHFSPHHDITSDRLHTLYHIQKQTVGICLVTASSLLSRLCPRDHINKDSLVVSTGESFDVEAMKNRLVQVGYQHRETVFEHGEFAVRGSLIDLFPMGSDLPYRIELFDTEVESLRTFEPESQRSIDRIDAISILPAGEIRLDEPAINQFRDQWHHQFNQNPDICPIYQDTLSGITSAGIEAYLPMFFENTETIFDYIPNNTTVFSLSDLETSLSGFLAETYRRYEQHAIDPTRPLLPPIKLYLTLDECFQKLNQCSHISLDSKDLNELANSERGEYQFAVSANTTFLIDEHSKQPLANIEKAILENQQGIDAFLLCVESIGRREILIEKLTSNNLNALPVNSWSDFYSLKQSNQYQPLIGIAISGFNTGSSFYDDNIAIIAEPELFGVAIKPKARNQKEKQNLAEATIHSLLELRIGAPIVHIDHGVGRYLGLERIPVPVSAGKSIDSEFLTLEYSGGDKLYVPVTSLHLINRYMGGDESSAPTSRLGSESWRATRKKVIANIHDVAAELLAIYAKRKSMQGYACSMAEEDYAKFSEQFPFEETIDQLTTINAVINDMQSETAMDRLVCGDVGFGKTEVAMRAAFMAVSNSKQVMLLVPTTLLAQQHCTSFEDRFADWPITINSLSRFKSASEQKQILESFQQGKTDIIIGTHKLIQKDIKPKNLGLVIVDEEHRFGVRQKEQLKRLCANVDLLTMTATPIPRTLNMAMAGLRDLSIITTPPARRLSVKTFVHEKQDSLTKEALLRELLRGGQVFYLHNEVNSIERTARELGELIPDARIAIGHGQMPERELEQVMSDFYHKKYNVLVCTTIIETGIDIPNANTIIIERADKFGLAQLHQLRGRVGRSHHQAYAYLFIPNKKLLTKDAEKRLQAIEEAQDLGAGFMLATHDLEIRGAGELLGDEQSGQIQSIGFSLYLDMLDRAVTALKSGEEIDLSAPLTVQGEINLHLAALIPDDYLPDIHNRLMLYKRIANAQTTAELRELQVEMIDRFGLLTTEIKHLFAIMTIKLACIPLGIDKIDAGPEGGYIEFSKQTHIDPMKIVSLVQNDPQTYQLKGATRLSFKMQLIEPQQRIEWIQNFVDELASE